MRRTLVKRDGKGKKKETIDNIVRREKRKGREWDKDKIRVRLEER